MDGGRGMETVAIKISNIGTGWMEAEGWRQRDGDSGDKD